MKYQYMNTMLFEERYSCKYKTDFIFNVGCKFVYWDQFKYLVYEK